MELPHAGLPPLTDRERVLYELLCRDSVHVQLCPTLRRVWEEFGTTYQNAYGHFQALARKGYLRKVGRSFVIPHRPK